MRRSKRGDGPDVEAILVWVTLLRALAALALGILVLVGAQTRPALANFIATYWLLGSVLTLRWVLANRGRPGSRAAFVAALVGIAAGVLVLLRFVLRDVISTDAVLGLLGVAAILTGILRLSGAFHDDPVGEHPRLRYRVVLAILAITLGAVLILAPGLTRPAAIVVGLWGLVAGAILLQDALTMRRQHRSRG